MCSVVWCGVVWCNVVCCCVVLCVCEREGGGGTGSGNIQVVSCGLEHTKRVGYRARLDALRI